MDMTSRTRSSSGSGSSNSRFLLHNRKGERGRSSGTARPALLPALLVLSLLLLVQQHQLEGPALAEATMVQTKCLNFGYDFKNKKKCTCDRYRHGKCDPYVDWQKSGCNVPAPVDPCGYTTKTPVAPSPIPPPFSSGFIVATKTVNPVTYPTFNTLSRYSTMGLTINPTTGAPSWTLSSEDVDWRDYLDAPGNQDIDGKQCGACWSFATAAAISAAYNIQSGLLSGSQGSVSSASIQQLLSCAPGNCSGGYPADALGYAASTNQVSLLSDYAYPYDGQKGTCNAASIAGETDGPRFPIELFEQTPFLGALGLMLAVQYQPVIVDIVAAIDSFFYYTGGIYRDPKCISDANPIPNHNVLVVGYHYEGPTSANNYFILRNSWGTSWGENGHMRIAMNFSSPVGVCGMLINPGLYPVLGGDQSGDSCTDGVCGGGTCNDTVSSDGSNGQGYFSLARAGRQVRELVTPSSASFPRKALFKDSLGGPEEEVPRELRGGDGNGAAYTCDCSSSPYLVEGTNRNGNPTCILKARCSVMLVNPCGVGTCQDDGTGGYTCVCPSQFQLGQKVDGSTTCVPLAGSSSLTKYTVQPGDTCYLVYTMFGLTETQFKQQNPGIDCTKELAAGVEVNVKPTSTYKGCKVRYPVSVADADSGSCATIQRRFPGVNLGKLNPGLDCTHLVAGQQVCVQGGSTTAYSMVQLCTRTVPIAVGDTCALLIQRNRLSYTTFYTLNSGFQCDNINALVGQQVCVAGVPLSTVKCKPPLKTYTVGRYDTCLSLVVTKFKSQPALVSQYNSGFMCTTYSLFVGLTLCTP